MDHSPSLALSFHLAHKQHLQGRVKMALMCGTSSGSVIGTHQAILTVQQQGEHWVTVMAEEKHN